ncbi:hypothetical protein ACP70R_007043 [Stipagrostis hirtigluma subsp. patula]
MARILAPSGGAPSGIASPWFVAICVAVVSLWAIALAVFLCGSSAAARDAGADAKKKGAAAKARSAVSDQPVGMFGGCACGAGCGGGCGGCGGG